MNEALTEERLKRLATEKSVRGAVVRLALQRADHIGPEQHKTLDAALRLLLERFARIPGQDL